MKKIIFLFLCTFLLLFSGGCKNRKATDAVQEYINKFRNNETEVTKSIDELLRQENILKEQEDLYRIIMKKQYTDLEYKIVRESYNGDEAIITVELTVYDYEHSRILAQEERNKKASDCQLTDGTWNKEKYIDLQLKYMKEEKRRVKYTVDFRVNLQDDNWVLENPNYKVIQKIHGIYSYNED